MKEDYAPQLRELLESGVELNDALGQLRKSGASPIGTIKAIHDVLDISTAYAKRMLSECPAWHDAVQAADQLHDDILKALEEE